MVRCLFPKRRIYTTKEAVHAILEDIITDYDSNTEIETSDSESDYVLVNQLDKEPLSLVHTSGLSLNSPSSLRISVS